MSDLAHHLIEKEKKERTGRLDLGRCGLRELPDTLFDLDWLEELILADQWFDLGNEKIIYSQNKGGSNNFSELSNSFHRLQNLKKLVIAGKNRNSIKISNLKPLTQLTGLQSLSLQNNLIKDISPLAQLTDLQYLNLNNNQLNDISSLAQLTNLQYLNLHNNQLNDINPLKLLTDLRFLGLSGNPISDIEPLKRLTNLQQLFVRGNQISDVSPLEELTKLQSLGLSSKYIKEISALAHLISLQHFDLRSEQVEDISPLAQLTGLKSLSLQMSQIEDISPLAQLTGLSSLNLQNNQIEDISPLTQLTGLSSLNLQNNQIKDTSPLVQLTGLLSLNLRNNQIEDISPLVQLTQLIGLLSFKLQDNRIEDISPLVQLTGLSSLNLRNNQIEDISPLVQLTGLSSLNLQNNRIEDISPLVQLTGLSSLNLQNNRIEDISPLAQLTGLSSLNLQNNRIEDISPLAQLTGLKYLQLQNNRIRDLSPLLRLIKENTPVTRNIGRKKSSQVNITNNPLETPPMEIFMRGRKAILNYFKQLEEGGGEKDYLFEAKLLIIGEAGAGKTTFARRIIDPNAPMPKKNESTHGINIDKWDFRINARDFEKLKNRETTFYVNLWDFGGQEIYHATHQFFFSEKSLYVLLADTREQKTDFSHWLNTIEQLCGEESVLFILLNKREKHDWNIDEPGYRSRFGKIMKEVHTIDLSISEDIPALQDRVRFWLKNLKGIGQPLIKSWVDIREALAGEESNTISLHRFREICAQHGQTREENIYYISQYFHRIGVFTHYIDEPALQDIIYLNSNHLVKKVYTLLDDELVKERKGRLTKDEIEKVWSKLEMGKIIALLDKFGLMYQANENQYIVPEHLPKIMPYNEWIHAREDSLLHFRYQFDKYMPKGLMSRLIVAMHEYIPDHDLVWHRGVNLSHNGAHAEVIEQYGGTNQFDIRIAGIFQRDLLVIITQTLDKILSDFKKLDVAKSIKCPCEECKASDKAYFHRTSDIEQALIKKYKKRNPKVECKNSYEDILITDLLMLIDYESVLDNLQEKAIDGALFDQFEVLKSMLIEHDQKVTDQLGDIESIFKVQHKEILEILNEQPNKVEINRVIQNTSKEMYEDVIQFLSVAFETNDMMQLEHFDEMKETMETLKASSDYWESKVKFAVPLLNLIGIQIEADFDLKKFIKNIKEKADALAIKHNIRF